MNPYNILIVEDEVDIARAIEAYLNNQGYKTFMAGNGIEGLEVLSKEEIHLAIVDVMMPKMDGITFVMKLREKYDFPVIMLSAKSEEVDKIMGLNIGADDYVVKPFSIKVLLKRMEVVLKRKSNENVFMCGQVILYSDRKQVFVGKTEISLTLKEYQLLEYFIMNQNQVLTKEMIMENIWGIDSEFIDPNTISVMISRLKKKLNESSKVISNVFGMGYRMGD